MNKGNAATTKTKKNEDNLKIESFSVDRAHMFENGGVVLDITLNGIRIYGVKVVEGKNGDFLSFPQRKGNDGKYYSIVYAKLSDQDTRDIILEAEKKLNN